MNNTIFALSLLTLASLCACGDVDPVHPLDPDTPIIQQHPSIVKGRLIPPTGFEASAVQGVTVHLDPIGTEAVSRTGAVAENGLFEIDEVIPGSYRVTAWGPGLSGGPVVVDIPLGAEMDVGTVPLVPVLGQVKGWVFTMSGQPATGAVVSSDDGYEVTVVDTEGRFTLRVLEGTRSVNVVLAQHDPWQSDSLLVDPWSEVNLAAPVFLPPFSGIVLGQVGLRQYQTPNRMRAISLKLDPIIADPDEMNDSEGDEEDPFGGADGQPISPFPDIREARTDFDPAEDGSFIVDNVDPGHYLLTIGARGYDSQTRPVFVTPGLPTNLGRIELAHRSTGHQAVRFEGRVRTGGVGLVGIGVDIVIVSQGNDADLEFRRVLTDSTGAFYVPVADDEWYRVSAVITGFSNLVAGPFRYFPGQGFRDPSGNSPDFNLGQAGP